MDFIEIMKERTPKIIGDTIEEVNNQLHTIKAQKENLLNNMNTNPSLKVFLKEKENHRMLILKAMTILEESKRTIALLDMKDCYLEQKTLADTLIILEKKIQDNIKEIMLLESSYYLRQKEVILFA